MTTNRIESVKTRAAALAMVLAPILLIVNELLTPVNHESDSAAEQLASVAREPGRYGLLILGMLAGMVLMIPATLTLIRHVRERGAWWGLIGGYAVILGLVMFCVSIGAMALTLTVFADLPAAQWVAMEPGVEAINDGKGVLWVSLFGLFFGLTLGSVVLAVGLWRSMAVPRWVAVAFPLGWWLFLLGPNQAVRALGPTVLLVVLGLVAWQSLRRDAPVAGRQLGSLDVERASS
ncbi:MAG: hypothetical protein ACRDJW_01085 [Thermomicrobiales bacterium]